MVDGYVLADQVVSALTPGARMRGLLGRPALRDGEALKLAPAKQVHTFGMKDPIDVVFCDADLVVLAIARRLAPWRVTKWVRKSRYVFELAAGAVPRSLAVGDKLLLSEGSRLSP